MARKRRRQIALVATVFTLAALPAFAQRPGGAGETIQTLSAKLDALTARVAKIEAGTITVDDIPGTYAVHALAVDRQGNSFPARIGTESFVGTVRVNE